MFEFFKKITTSESTKKTENSPVTSNKPQTFERKSEEPRQTLNNGLSKQLFSDIKTNKSTISATSKNPEISMNPSNDKKFKIFDDKNAHEEEKAESFANYMNASMNFGKLKSQNSENFKEIHMNEAQNKEMMNNQLSKNIVNNNNAKSTLTDVPKTSNLRKKIFDEQPQKKLGDDHYMNNELRKNSDDLIAEKSLNILQCNQNVIMNYEDNLNAVLKEIDAHYFNENTEDNLIHKELLRLPKNTKIDEVAARVEVLDRYSNTIASKLSKNALKHYEKFGD